MKQNNSKCSFSFSCSIFEQSDIYPMVKKQIDKQLKDSNLSEEFKEQLACETQQVLLQCSESIDVNNVDILIDYDLKSKEINVDIVEN